MPRARLLATALIAAVLGAAPAAAQSSDSDDLHKLPDKVDDALRQLMERMRPALEGLADTVDVFKDIDSIENYQAPEVLPNGDILIRRRADAPPWPPDEPPAEPREKRDGGGAKETEQGIRT